ncbi:phage/plasmid primase, P4 family [Mesobacillus subterraneus]|uniref:phage/plasmid primase, P4 family n=1 Tax=Mesobacillus subterraneus TaxID=285983 RepID=UPI002040089D|nr:phage/plasmid primase, P4 family [Mesobacillus subterraneus]MCM3665541.1 phage/plasmid primase, P4 family [Mesobacillus subterraneus]MCM3686100.1 phage/plasmid primase, P4 family [Mesobacillus subterraneus]
MKYDFTDIPDELKKANQWIVWKSELREGEDKPTKVPYQTNGVMAQSNNKRTWSSFHSAVHTYNKGGYEGIGFMFSKEDPYIGIDIDKCYKDGKFSELADEVIEMMDSYTELSPSGTGVHIIVKGELPIEKGTGKKNSKLGLEIYRYGRYFTFTGKSQNVYEIVERTSELSLLFKKYFPDDDKKPSTVKKPVKKQNDIVNLSNSEIWVKMFKSKNGSHIQSLYNGELIDGDHSSTDLALCNHLAFWTNKDIYKMDDMFRESGLYREKWDKQHSSDGRTYGEMTLEAAMQSTHNTIADFEPKTYKINILNYEEPIEKAPNFMRTDLGNAERLIYRFGKDLRYNNAFKKWYIWDGKRWREDDTNQIKQMAKHTVRMIYKEASQEEESEARAALSKHAVGSESRSRLEAMIALSESEVPILPDDMDKDQMLFNCANGVVNLETGEFLEHNREFYMNKISPIAYDPNADCPLWKKFLEDIMQDEEGNVKQELINFLQKAIGYALTGDTSEQVLFFLYGKGRNGKSTFLDTIRYLFGDYGQQTNTETFSVRKNEGARSDLATLKGSRLVAASESEEGARLAESLIKQLTGGEPIQARFLYGNPFVYKPEFKIFFTTNHKPIIKGSDEGIWRRIRLVPFTVTIPKEKVDKHLGDKLLQQEMSGILRWAVEGCLKWQKEGLGNPKEVQEATDDYRGEMDAVGNFLKEYCVFNDAAKCYVKDLYQKYEEWCIENGEYLLTRPKFNRKVEERGYKKNRDNKGYYFNGLGINFSFSSYSSYPTSYQNRKKV